MGSHEGAYRIRIQETSGLAPIPLCNAFGKNDGTSITKGFSY
jgi:hypothetical protein